MKRTCVICKGENMVERNGYVRCLLCGHESIIKEMRDANIVNDELDVKKVKRVNALDRFRVRVALATSRDRGYLLDIGSASGKFMYHCLTFFKTCQGVEVTKACVDFSRSVLGLRVAEDIGDIPRKTISLATFWHSLEHINIDSIRKIFDTVDPLADRNTRVVISVPNNGSLLYRLFGRHFAYFDDASHVHQFSPASLNMLMKQFGYQKEQKFRSFAYASFGSLQTILNMVNKRHNFLYYYLKRGNSFDLGKKRLYALAVYNFCLLPFAAIPAAFFTVVDLMFFRYGGVMTVCYRINRQ